MKVALVIVAVLAGLFIIWVGYKSDQDHIRNWAEENHFMLIDTNEPLFDQGPFYYKNDGQHIYKVRVKDKFEREYVCWMRTGVFSWDYEWQDGKKPD